MARHLPPITGAPVVDLYCRVSRDEQENNTSLDEQEACGREYCTEQGLIVGEVHREVYTGYKYRERKKLGRMRSRYRDGKIQGVVIRTLDRLSRHQTHIAVLLEEMEHHGITVHCVKEKIDTSPMGKFVTYKIPGFFHVTGVRLVGKNFMLDVWFFDHPQPIWVK